MILHRQSGWRYSPRAARCQLDVSLYSESVAAMHRLLQILKRPAVATAGVALVLLVAVSTAAVAASHRRADVGAAPSLSGHSLSGPETSRTPSLGPAKPSGSTPAAPAGSKVIQWMLAYSPGEGEPGTGKPLG
jgi:hypothetical protein